MSGEKKSREIHPNRPRTTARMDDPFAITTSGTVLVNVQNFDDVESANDALRRALQERTPIFIGVAMTAREVRFVLDHLGDIWHDPAGFVIGARQQRAKGRRS